MTKSPHSGPNIAAMGRRLDLEKERGPNKEGAREKLSKESRGEERREGRETCGVSLVNTVHLHAHTDSVSMPQVKQIREIPGRGFKYILFGGLFLPYILFCGSNSRFVS